MPLQSGRRHYTFSPDKLPDAQGDVVGLKGDVARALRELGEAPAREGSAVAALAELERVKARMEAACSTLKAGAPCWAFLCPTLVGLHESGRRLLPASMQLHCMHVLSGFATSGQSVKFCFHADTPVHVKRE